MTLERVLPLACFALFVLVGIGVRVAIHFVRQGSTGVLLFQSGRRDQTIREVVFLAVAVTFAGHAIAAVVAPELLAPIAFVPATLAWPFMIGGACVVAIATALMFAAQVGLGASWRIGIDEEARPGLVTTGFYSLSRNPIYVFLIAAVIGFVLLVPTWLSLATLAVAVWLVRRQVAAEEDYLARAYGDEFHGYARRVGRFLPFFGRSR